MLVINGSKTNYMVFGSNFASQLGDLFLGDNVVTRVDHVRYLGVLLDSHLSWKYHCNFVADKVYRGVGMLKKIRNELPQSCLLSVYYSFIYSYVSYAIVLWGSACMKYLHPIIIAQKEAIRIIADMPRLTHCAPLARQLHILFLEDVYKLSLACLMFSVQHNSAHCVLLTNFLAVNYRQLCLTRASCANKFFVPRVHSNICKTFIFYRGVTLWNSLPANIIDCTSVFMFKSASLLGY